MKKFPTATLAVAVFISNAAAQSPTRPPPDDWLRLVPADARLYVEIHDLLRIQQQLTRLGVWTAIDALSERADASPSTRPGRSRLGRMLGMTPEQAVSVILGKRAALMARDPQRWRQGVVLAEMKDAATVTRMLRQWKAEPLPARQSVECYRLPQTGMRVARRGALMLFVMEADPDGLGEQVTRLLAGGDGGRWLDDPAVRRMRSRIGSAVDGLIVVSPPRDSASKRSGAVMAVLRFSERHLKVDIQRDADRKQEVSATQPVAFTSVVEAHAGIAAWQGQMNATVWRRELERGSPESLWQTTLGMARRVFGDEAMDEGFFSRIGPGIALVLLPHPQPRETGYSVPAILLAVEARDPPRVADDFGRLVSVLTAYVNTQLVRSGASVSPLNVDSSGTSGTRIHTLPLGRALAAYSECPYLRDIELAWTQTDQALLVSTSSAALLERVNRPPATQPSVGARGAAFQRVYVDGQGLANMLQSWMTFGRRTAPAVMRESWWIDRARRRARAGEYFGATLRGIPGDPPQALVEAVAEGSDAARVLRPGDLIERVDGVPLDMERPARSVVELFRVREQDDVVRLDVMREGRSLSVTASLPRGGIDPTEVFYPLAVLRPLASMSRAIESLDYAAYPDGQAELVIRWRSTPAPATKPAP